jgi:hypothetical protein
MVSFFFFFFKIVGPKRSIVAILRKCNHSSIYPLEAAREGSITIRTVGIPLSPTKPDKDHL